MDLMPQSQQVQRLQVQNSVLHPQKLKYSTRISKNSHLLFDVINSHFGASSRPFSEQSPVAQPSVDHMDQ